MSEPQKKVRISIPTGLSSSEREELSDEIIEHIRKRTQSGKDVEGKPFAPYSKNYINSLDFKNAGKSASRVDLTLSEDMLEAMEVLSHGSGYITIGYEEGSAENDKAVWNERAQGTKRKKGPARKFLGISTQELASILDSYILDNQDNQDE